MSNVWHEELLNEDQAAQIEEWLTDPKLSQIFRGA